MEKRASKINTNIKAFLQKIIYGALCCYLIVVFLFSTFIPMAFSHFYLEIDSAVYRDDYTYIDTFPDLLTLYFFIALAQSPGYIGLFLCHRAIKQGYPLAVPLSWKKLIGWICILSSASFLSGAYENVEYFAIENAHTNYHIWALLLITMSIPGLGMLWWGHKPSDQVMIRWHWLRYSCWVYIFFSFVVTLFLQGHYVYTILLFVLFIPIYTIRYPLPAFYFFSHQILNNPEVLKLVITLLIAQLPGWAGLWWCTRKQKLQTSAL